jgi:hypothetical protein
MQNLAWANASAPQFEQRRASGDPHDMQKRAAAGLAVPQLPQRLSSATDSMMADGQG